MPITKKVAATDLGQKKASGYEDHFENDAATAKVTKSTTVQKTASKEVIAEKSTVDAETGVVVPPHRLARVTVGGGCTINTGNFENVKINVEITLPCDMDDVHDAYNSGLQFVDGKIDELKNAIENGTVDQLIED